MKLLNPAGLWLLLGIPVLIIIYLIKAQHEDRPVSSTFIWKLSSRFMKKRLPMQRLRKILLFILQLLIIASTALLAARPAVVNGNCCDYIAIIDASASMQTVDEAGVSRFQRAVDQVNELTDKIPDGHTVSLILASDSAVCLVERSTSVNEVQLAVEGLQCKIGDCNITDALSVAELICQRSENAQVLFYTDNPYSEPGDVQVVNLSADEWNVTINNIEAGTDEEGNTLFTAYVTSNRITSLTLGLRIDGQVTDAQILNCALGENQLTFTVEQLEKYDTVEVFTEVADGLPMDNVFGICKERERTYRVMLVSQTPLYLQGVLRALGNCEVTTVSSLEGVNLSGQDVYVFDGVLPETYPQDGSMLIFGTEQLPVDLRANTVVSDEADLKTDPATSADVTGALTFVDTVVTEYAPLHGSSAWKRFLYCGEDVVGATKMIGGGRSISVVSFDLHNTNLPLQQEFVELMGQLVEYAVPAFLKQTDYATNESVTLTVLSGAQQIYAQLPDGAIKELTAAKDTCKFSVEQVGMHTAVMITAAGGEYADFFVHIPVGESVSADGGSLVLPVPTAEAGEVEEAFTEIWFWLALAALLIVLLEWGWYYREQY